MSSSSEWIGLIIIAGVAFATKPDDSGIYSALYKNIKTQVINSKELSINNNDNLLSGILKFGCVFDIDGCTKYIMSTLKTKDTDLVVGKLKQIVDKDGDKVATCFGAFKNLWCP